MNKTAEGQKKAKLAKLRPMPTASGQTMLLSPEEFPIYHLHVNRFLMQLEPQSEAEATLVQRIADNEWRLDRIARLEMGVYAHGRVEFAHLYPEEPPEVRSILIETHAHLTYARDLDKLIAQETRLRRYVEADRAELRGLQKKRQDAETLARAPLVSVAGAAAASAPKETDSGFAFSDRRPPTPVVEMRPQRTKTTDGSKIDLRLLKTKPTRH